MKYTFCTLFNSNYLDKGIIMINSLLDVCNNCEIYVLAMDKQCDEVMKKEYKNISIIQLNDFIEFENLEEIYRKRTPIEFFYTCSSHLVHYILVKLKEEICTYIDADLCFYSNPISVIKEMKNKPVQFIEHRFSDTLIGRINERKVGKFCVEFNTFTKKKQSLEILNIWREKCKKYCGYNNNNFGDQKYLNELYDEKIVSIVNNKGAGLAPWNISQFYIKTSIPFVVIEKKTNKNYQVVFYHFENIEYVDDNTININVYKLGNKHDNKLIDELYKNYFNRTLEVRKYLYNKYNITFNSKKYHNHKIKNKININDLILRIYFHICNKKNGKLDIMSIETLQ